LFLIFFGGNDFLLPMRHTSCKWAAVNEELGNVLAKTTPFLAQKICEESGLFSPQAPLPLDTDISPA
jgi:hypothetical protein